MRRLFQIATSCVLTGLLLSGATSAAGTEDARPAEAPATVSGDYLTEEDIARIAVPDARQTLKLTSSNPSLATPNCIVCGTVPILRYNVVSGPVLIKERWAKYLTGVWAKASSYTWSKTTTTSATLSADIGSKASSVSSSLGLSASRSKSWSISITVPASSSRYSKLSLLGDYQRRYIKKGFYSPETGKLITDASYSYLYTPTTTQYIKVTYKS